MTVSPLSPSQTFRAPTINKRAKEYATRIAHYFGTEKEQIAEIVANKLLEIDNREDRKFLLIYAYERHTDATSLDAWKGDLANIVDIAKNRLSVAAQLREERKLESTNHPGLKESETLEVFADRMSAKDLKEFEPILRKHQN